jgi:WD40 repeat protein
MMSRIYQYYKNFLPRHATPIWRLLVFSIMYLAFIVPESHAIDDEVRYVPQLGLTNLNPVKISYRPGDPRTLMVVNRNGRIDLFNISNLDHPIKTAEIDAHASDAAFSPSGDQIVSGGADSLVRLWTLEGKPASPPFRGHYDRVTSVRYDPAGTHIVSGSLDGTVRIWTLDGSSAIDPIQAHEGGVRSVAVSPTGDLIASAGDDGAVRLWTFGGIAAAEPSIGHEGEVWVISFDQKGEHFVSGGRDGTVRLWKANGSPASPPFRGHEGWVGSVAFSHSGHRIASGGSDGTLRTWSLDGKPAAEPVSEHAGQINSVTFNPTDEIITSGGIDGTIRFWKIEGENSNTSFAAHGGATMAVALSPDGERIVSGGQDGLVKLWTLEGEPIGQPFKGHDGWVSSVKFNPAGDLIVSAGQDGTVRLWTLDGTPAAEPFRGHEGTVLHVAVSPLGNLIASGGDDGTMRLWKLDGTPAAEPFKGNNWIWSLAFHPAGDRIAAGDHDGVIRIWKLDGTFVTEPFQAHDGAIRSVTFNPLGNALISGGQDGVIRHWALDGAPSPTLINSFNPTQSIDKSLPAGWINSVAVNPAGDRIVFGSQLLSAGLFKPDGTMIGLRAFGSSWIWSVAFGQRKDRVVAGTQGGGIFIWKIGGTPVGTTMKGQDDLSDAILSSSGDRIVRHTPPYGDIHVHALDSTQLSSPIQLDGHSAWSLAFNATIDRAASGQTDGVVRLWDTTGAQVGDQLLGHDGPISTLAFNPASDKIASGGYDGTVRLWKFDGTPATEPFRGHDGIVLSVAFNPVGDRIVSGGLNGAMRLWTHDGKLVSDVVLWSQASIRAIAFTPDGDRVVAGDMDGLITVWDPSDQSETFIRGCAPWHIQVLANRSYAFRCSDRIQLLDESFAWKGDLFPHKDGVIVVTAEGVLAPTDELHLLVRGIGKTGALLTSRGAVPAITLARARQILFDDWTDLERLLNAARRIWQDTLDWYDGLDIWTKRVFWPALLWVLALVSAISLWIVVPARLAHWAMPVAGAPPPPPYTWLLDVITLYRWFGLTRRPLKAWLRARRAVLEVECFTSSSSVEERSRYSTFLHRQGIAAFNATIKSRSRAIIWIDGVGGSGKSALAFHLVRESLLGQRRRPIPVLVEEDWEGSLAALVAERLREHDGDRGPTEAMVKTLGAAGWICPVVDSLSERAMKDAVEKVGRAISERHFRHIIVTSRKPPPTGHIWQRVDRMETRGLEPEDVPAFVATYAPPDRCAEIEGRIAGLITPPNMPSPLFLRFAIEQAMLNPLSSTEQLDLVLHYVEALRADKINLDADDMARAASIAAVEAVRDHLVPREIERPYLRGMLMAEADKAPFMDAKNEDKVAPVSVVEMLVSSGLLKQNRTNRRLQFAYDPVAEYLAAWRLTLSNSGTAELKERIHLAPDSAIGRALHDIEASRSASALAARVTNEFATDP